MNRRAFAATGLAAFFLGSARLAAQQSIPLDTSVKFELVNATLAFSSGDWQLLSSGVHDEGWEYANLDAGHSTLHIQIVPENFIAPEDFSTRFIEDLDPAEIMDRQGMDDGGWALAFSEQSPFNRFAYCEYQLGSFPGHNLQIRFWGREDVFHNDFDKAQRIDLAGAPPFLFLTESGIENLDTAAEGNANAGSESTASSSTTRGNSENATGTGNGSSADDYVATVNEHREEFLESYDRFLDHLQSLGDMDDDEKIIALTIMVNIALTWQPYSDQAAVTAVPNGLETLGSLYGEWAGCVTDMGYLFEEFYIGNDVAEEFVDATVSWEQADSLLVNELEILLAHIPGREAVQMVALSGRVEAMAQTLAARDKVRLQRHRSLTLEGNVVLPSGNVSASFTNRVVENLRVLALN